MKKYIVYAYISPSNKRYIGQTCNSLRVRAANGEGYKACPKFYQAIKKYGWKNFSVSILNIWFSMFKFNILSWFR